MYDPDRDFVPLFDFSAPLTGFGNDFEDENGEKHTCISANSRAVDILVDIGNWRRLKTLQLDYS